MPERWGRGDGQDPPPPAPNIHFPQGSNVEGEVSMLMGVPEQILTGQSSHPVIKLAAARPWRRHQGRAACIQDAVVVGFCPGPGW